MTPLNAEKYLRGLPEKQDREAAGRLAALCAAMGLTDAERRVCLISCAGLYARNTAGMLGEVMKAAKIPAVGLFFGEPYTGGYARSVVFGGEKLPPNEFAVAVDELRKAARECGFADTLGRYEALEVLALRTCIEHGAKVLISDRSALPSAACRMLPHSDLVILGAVSGDARTLLHSLITRETAETVSAPQTPAAHVLITDRCAETGCRLTVAARAGLPGGPEIRSLTFGGILFVYRGIEARSSSVFASSLCCVSAVIDGVRALRRSGYEISDEATAEGLRRAEPMCHGSVVSLRPALIAEALPDGEFDSAVYYSSLAADIAAASHLVGRTLSVFMLFREEEKNDVGEHLLEAFASNGIKVVSVYRLESDETLAAAARRVAKDMIIKDEEVDSHLLSADDGRSFLIIGKRASIDEALPYLRRGITRTMI